MLQNVSRETLERTITIAKGNSSLGKCLIFHTYLPNQLPCQEEKLNLVLIFLAVDKKIGVVNFSVLLMVSRFMYSLFFLKWLTGLFSSDQLRFLTLLIT